MTRELITPHNRSAAFAAFFFAACLATTSAMAQLGAQDMKNGQSALADSRFVDAEHYFIKYLSANQRKPDYCVEALNYLCLAVFKQKRYDEVIQLLNNNADIASTDKSGIFDYWRARSVFAMGLPDEAIAILDDALKAVKDNGFGTIRLHRLKGIVLSQSSAPDAVESTRSAFSNANARASQQLGDDFAAIRLDTLLDWAAAELKFGNMGFAENILKEQMTAAHSISNSASAQKGAILYAKLIAENGHANDAESILSRMAENAGAFAANRAEALAAVSTLCADTNKIDRYYAILSGLDLPPSSLAESQMRFGKALALKEDNALRQRGVNILSGAVKRNATSPYAPECQLVLANTLLLLGSNTLANAEFKNYTDAFSGEKANDFIAKKGRASALYLMREFDESALCFTEAAALASTDLDSSRCLAQAADAYYNSTKYSRAAELYKQAAAQALAVGDAALSLSCRFKSADSAEQTGDLQTALVEFSDLASDNAAGELSRQATLRKASIFEQLDRREEAENAFSAVLNVETNNETTALARLGRGRTRYRRFKFESAKSDLEKIPAAYTNIADEAAYIKILAEYGLGRDEVAFSDATDFITNRTEAANLPDVLLWAAQYDFNRKNYASAEKHFLDFTLKFPEHPVAQHALLWAAESAFKQSEFARANDTLAKISTLSANQEVIPGARLLQARSLRELTRYEDALSVLDEMITEYPADDLVVSALILKGETLFVMAGKDPGGVGYLKAEETFSSALLRSDINPDQIIECSFNSARCFEKAGDSKKAVEMYCVMVIDRYADFTTSHVRLSATSADYFARSAFNAASIREKDGDIESAIKILNHLATTSLPDSGKASEEIRRLKTK